MSKFKFAGIIEVHGTCQHCKVRIEGAANALTGISNANWSEKTKLLSFDYDVHLVSVNQLHEHIVSLGYDTDEYQTTYDAYMSLPETCRHKGA